MNGLADLFTAPPETGQANGMLEGLAAESLARLVEAQSRIESGTNGGLVVTLEWTTGAVRSQVPRRD